VTLCAACTVHVEMRSVGFLVDPQNQGRVSWLSLKTKDGFLGLASKARSTISPGLASKSVATVLVVWPQNHSIGFPTWASKPVAVVW
jgi:hypothetical protein